MVFPFLVKKTRNESVSTLYLVAQRSSGEALLAMTVFLALAPLFVIIHFTIVDSASTAEAAEVCFCAGA